MPEKTHIRWFYAIGLTFLAGLILSAIFESYWLAALPFVPIFFFVLFYRTELLIYFLAFATPLSIPIEDVGGGLGMSIPTEPLIVLVFILAIIQWVAGKGFDRRLLKEPLTIVIGLEILWMIVTSITGSMFEVSAKYTLARIWFVTVFYVALFHMFKSLRSIKIFLACFVIAAAILASYTLFSHAQHSFTRFYAYTAMRPFLPDHGMYAALLSFAILPAIIYTLWAGKLGGSINTRLGAAIITFILAAGLVFSFTRASWISVVVALALLGLMLMKVKFKTIVISVIVLVSLFVLFSAAIFSELSRNKSESDDDIFTHLSSVTNISSDPSNLERLNRWSCAYRMFEDKPHLGFGPGTYTYQYGPYQLPQEMSIISTSSGNIGGVHSEYLRPLSESGWVGFALYCTFVLLAVYQGFVVFFKARKAEVRLLALAVLLGLVTYFVHGLLNNYSDFDKIAVPLWSFSAILMALKIHHMHSPLEGGKNDVLEEY